MDTIFINYDYKNPHRLLLNFSDKNKPKKK